MSVTGGASPKIGAFLGRAPHFCLKMSADMGAEGVRARRPAAAAVLALPRGFFRFFALFLEKVKKCPPPRIEPTVSPIFGRGRDQ